MNKEILKLFKGYLGKTTISINDSDGLKYIHNWGENLFTFPGGGIGRHTGLWHQTLLVRV